MSQSVKHLACIQCGRLCGPDPGGGQWLTCAGCGPTDGILDVRYDLDVVINAWRREPLHTRPRNQWRYHELLPIDRDRIPQDWHVGWTPLVNARRMAGEFGLRRLVLKDEGRNPTASFKDRASSVGVVHALQLGATTIACASTGNAATSLAGHAALAGLPAVIFVPQTIPEPKLAQLLIYGATVVAVQGSYRDAYMLCSAACERFGWYNRNCAINPVLVEGKKTAGLEIAEQCGLAGELPDWVAVSVGDGCTIAGIWKGLREMHELGVIDRLPRLLGVQAAGVSPVEYAARHGELPGQPGSGTFADSIDVPVPRNWRKAVAAVRESGGRFVCVTDDDIRAAMRTSGCHGVSAEPAAAAALAGVVHAVSDRTVCPEDSVLVMVTGSGLKDTNAALRVVDEPVRIPADLEKLTEALTTRTPRASANVG